jgi:hypothetical protein
VYHLEGEVDPGLGRYSSALRRHRWKIAGAAALGAVVFGVLSLGTESSTQVNLGVLSDASELTAVGLEIDDFTGTLSGVILKAEMGQRALEREAEAAAGGSLDVTVTDTSTPTSITLRIDITASSDSEVLAAADFYRNAFDSSVTARVAPEIASLQAVLAERRDSATARIDELATDLSDAPRDSSLADAIIIERIDLQSEVRRIDDQAAAAASFEARTKTVAETARVSQSGGGLVPFIAGALLAGLVAVAVTLVFGFFDRRVRQRADVEQASAGPVIGMVTLDTPGHLDALAMSMQRRSPSTEVVLLPAHPSVRVDGLAEALRARGVSCVVAPCPVGGFSADTVSGRNAAIVVEDGRTTRRDLSLAATVLHDSCVPLLGAIIVASNSRALSTLTA